MRLLFRNRQHAGEVLTTNLGAYAGRDDVIVLALPRGGVPVAFEVLLYNHTRAVEPLERTALWERGEVPETYASALLWTSRSRSLDGGHG